MSVRRQHRVTIFLDDEELKRLYDAVAKEKRPIPKILRKALMEYLNKVESDFEKPKPEDVVVEDKEAVIL